jgi:hypothetical protein
MSTSTRSFRQALEAVRCWDADVQRVFEARGEPLVDCALQNREELIALCEFFEREKIRSYLEIGIWTGRLLSALASLFSLDPLAACDHGWAQRHGLPLQIPKHVRFLQADSDSDAYLEFRQRLGHIDLVLIDGDHRYHAAKRDYEINRQFSQRFIAFHDITGHNPQTRGVAQLWQELDGDKIEIILPHRELGLDCSTMGIGLLRCQA